jgi:hypothetical protein
MSIKYGLSSLSFCNFFVCVLYEKWVSIGKNNQKELKKMDLDRILGAPLGSQIGQNEDKNR